MSSYPREARAHFQGVKDKNGVSKEFHRGKVHSVGWNCTGKRLASGSSDRTAAVYSVRDKLTRNLELKGHTDSVDQLCWHPSDPNLLSTASGDKTVRIWDCRSSKPAKTIQTQGENINITWSPDGSNIAVGNKVDVLSFIDTKTWKVIHKKDCDFEVNEISWDNNTKYFYLTTGHGCLEVLEWPSLQKATPAIKAHTGNCICIRFDPKNKYFATGSADSLTSLWDVNELVCVQTFSRTEWPIRQISFSHDGQLLATASEDPFIDIAYVETGERVHQIAAPEGTFTVAWHPSRILLAFAGDEKDKDGRDSGKISLFGLPQAS